MPDKFGFDHLGEQVRCIQPGCEVGGMVGKWSSERRLEHLREHGKEVKSMSNSSTTQKTPTVRVMYEVLVKAGKPLTTKEIVKRTLADKRAHPKGATPEVTLAAVLYKVAGQGRMFKRVGKGTFKAIPEKSTAAAKPAPRAAAKKAAPKKTTAKRSTAKRSTAKRSSARSRVSA